MSKNLELMNRTLDLVEKTLLGDAPMKKPEPYVNENIGIFNGVRHEEYLKLPHISKSGLDQIHRSPAHFKEYLENPPEPTPRLELGSAFHQALLLPKEFNQNYTLAPDVDRRTKVGKEMWSAIEESGRTPLKIATYDQIMGMVEAVKRHPEASHLLIGGETELSCVWRDRGTGVICKCRPDLIFNGIIVDVKTTADASQNAFMRSIAKYRYHVQAAFYQDGISHFERADKFLFICVETTAPYAVAVYALDEGAIDKGLADYRKDLEVYAECKRADKWPGYPTDIMDISLPAWAFWGE